MFNMYKYGRAFTQYIEGEKRQSVVMLSYFTQLADYVVKHGGTVSFEWPRYCSGWKLEELVSFIGKYQMQEVLVDGCSVGVKRAADGKPILKPWRFVTNSVSLIAALEPMRCSKTHDHVPCAGKDTKQSGFYTQELAELIVKSCFPKHNHVMSCCRIVVKI